MINKNIFIERVAEIVVEQDLSLQNLEIDFDLLSTAIVDGVRIECDDELSAELELLLLNDNFVEEIIDGVSDELQL